MDDENESQPLRQIVVGEDLSNLSVDELEARIVELETDIARTREAITHKGHSLAAADALFGKAN